MIAPFLFFLRAYLIPSRVYHAGPPVTRCRDSAPQLKTEKKTIQLTELLLCFLVPCKKNHPTHRNPALLSCFMSPCCERLALVPPDLVVVS